MCALSEKLQFLGEIAWKTERPPLHFHSLIKNTNTKIAILHVMKLKIGLNDRAPCEYNCRVLIAYTATGKVFFVSSNYVRFSSLTTMVSTSSLFDILNCTDVCIIYKFRNVYVCTTLKELGKKWQSLGHNKKISKYVNDVCHRLTKNFKILHKVFPRFVTLETNGSSFINKIVSACSGLLNYKLSLTQH